MEKITIEVEIPKGLDLKHTLKAVTDALYLPENVTQKEYSLVESMLDKLIVKQMEEQIKIIDGFVWLIITHKAKEVFGSCLFSVYKLHHDGSESLCESYADINDALEFGLELAIEVGHLPS